MQRWCIYISACFILTTQRVGVYTSSSAATLVLALTADVHVRLRCCLLCTWLDYGFDLGILGCFHTRSEGMMWYMEISFQFHGLLQRSSVYFLLDSHPWLSVIALCLYTSLTFIFCGSKDNWEEFSILFTCLCCGRFLFKILEFWIFGRLLHKCHEILFQVSSLLSFY